MKKLLLVLLAVVFSASCMTAFVGCSSRQDTLIVYNWEDYIDESVLPEFEAYYKMRTGKSIKVDYQKFDVNETMLKKVIEGGGDYDVICPSDYAIEKLIEQDLLAEIDYSNITNRDNLISSTVSLAHDPDNKYSVPYMWGTVGILYNADYVTEDDLAEGFGLLWNANSNTDLADKMLMKKSVRDAMVAAVAYAYQDELLALANNERGARMAELINVTDTAVITSIEDSLEALKAADSWLGWEVDDGKDDIINGVAYVNLAWSGDALYAIEESEENLAFFVPDEGSNIWVDGWVIPKSATNKTAAEIFIDFMLSPETAMKNMMEVGYCSSVKPEALQASEAAMEILEENEYDATEFFEDINRYPTDEIVARCAVMENFSSTVEEAVGDMWTRIIAG